MDNYFEFFEIDEKFKLDLVDLRKKFINNSRKFHPDFYSLASEEEQQHAMNQSTINNIGYKKLSNEESRIEYILRLNGKMDNSNSNIPNDFLMEMMDINEELMELEFDFDEERFMKCKQSLDKKMTEVYADVESDLEEYSPFSERREEILDRMRDYYLKNKYLLRIKEKINTFAGR